MSRRPIRTAQLVAAAASVVLSLSLTPARAVETSWSSPTSGRWLDPANWSTSTLPTSADPVTIFAPGGPYTVTLDASAPAGPLTLNNPEATLLIDAAPSTVTLTTAGDINIAAGTLALHTHDSAIFVQSPSPSSPIDLTNAGRIDFMADSPFDFYTATFGNLRNVSNSGTIEVHDSPPGRPDVRLRFLVSDAFANTGALRTGARSQIEANAATFSQNAGTIDGIVKFNGNTFNFNGGSVSTVLLAAYTLNIAPTAGSGTFVAQSYLSVNGDLAANQTFYVAPARQIAWTGPTLTNAGHLLLGTDPLATSSFGGSSSFTLPHPTDTLTNTGTIDLNSPQSGPSIITGNVLNSGTVRVATPRSNTASSFFPTSLAGHWTNNGSVSIAVGTYTALSSGSNFTQSAGGSLAVAAEPLTLTNAHFYYNGGSVSGNIALNNSTVHFAPGLTSPGGTFTFSSSNPTTKLFEGDIPAGITFAHAPTASLILNLTSFSNAGTFLTNLSSPSFRPIYRLDNFAGTLINTGTLAGTLNIPSPPAPPGGPDRGIALELDGNLTNTGSIKAYNLTVLKGTFNQNAGTINVDTLCNVSQGTFNYNGGTLTGKPVGLNASTLNIAPGTNPASFAFYAGNSTFHGAITPGTTVALDSIATAPSSAAVTADPFTNAGTLSLAATLAVFNSTLTIPNNGTLTNTGTLSVTKGFGGTRTLNANVVNTSTFSVGPGATLTLAGSLTTSTPLDLQGTLNLKTGPFLWTYTGPSPIDSLRSLLATSHLISSSADATHRLGYLDTGSSLTTLLTLAGDANCDGTLNADDYALLDRAYAKSLASAHWQDGDFNYDGQITSADYLLIDATYLQQQGGTASFLAIRESQFGADYVAQLLTSVPEPTSAAYLFAGLLPLLARRGRRGK